MIYVGLDDTDVIDSPGTNQLAKSLVAQLTDTCACHLIVRHQLFFDPRVPYTSKNGSASVWLVPHQPAGFDLVGLIDRIATFVGQHAALGSDPGVCVATQVPDQVSDFGRQCQTEVVTQSTARRLAHDTALYLAGLGGTQDGVIGALAAVGLAATGNDGRIVQMNGHDDVAGTVTVASLTSLGIIVRQDRSNEVVSSGRVNVGKHLRPNLFHGDRVLYVRAPQAAMGDETPPDWEAVKR